MAESTRKLQPEPLERIAWQTQEIVPSPRSSFAEESLLKEIAKRDNGLANRIRPAMMLSWLRRCQAKVPVVLSAMHLNNATLLHLPAESFVEYQLRAQSFAPGRFVATAAYGDGGPWYVPVQEAYPQGGYEVGVAFSEPTIDDMLSQGIRRLVTV
jgi:hypothetical protein